MTTRSEQLFAEAQRYLPGGVNSPVRAFRGVGGTPIFFKRGAGAYLYDEDGRRYIDYVGSWGPVSYTHLDVYKRQERHPLGKDCAPVKPLP